MTDEELIAWTEKLCAEFTTVAGKAYEEDSQLVWISFTRAVLNLTSAIEDMESGDEPAVSEGRDYLMRYYERKTNGR